MYPSISPVLAEVVEVHLFPSLSHTSLISIEKLYDVGFKAIFDEQTVNITRKVNSIVKIWKDHQTGLWRLPLHNQ